VLYSPYSQRLDDVKRDELTLEGCNILGTAAALAEIRDVGVVVVPVTMISLVVGGIVIMNIMLVSVTERTKEIGIRKSLGARSADIQVLVLAESILISALGGLMGIAVAWGLVEVLISVLEVKMRITWPYVVLAVFVSSGVGLISGWYPARRAARMDPIEALRAE
ncbi:MAG: ABC transporter permease, partial [Acidobacteriota bacterium]